MALSLQYDEAAVIRQYFADRIAPGSDFTMIDVGADFGTSFRSFLNAGWRVIAFEPDARKFAKLAPYESNPRLELLKVAVSDAKAEGIAFYTSPESTGISSLLPFRDSHTPQRPVSVVTLREILQARGIRQVQFLKIDTEGYDLAVLKGNDWTIKPEVILTEFDEVKTRCLGHHFTAMGDLLMAHGYTVFVSEWFPLVRYGANHQWRALKRYPCVLEHPDAWGNLIAISADADLTKMRSLLTPHIAQAVAA